ncbi:LysR family transcriptional regulator [Blastomonas natatoria]|uniref:LysR family transcriptional regulator n=1 Tax=Blastomonas natatoria TaxID=34015 RepID=A0A2V3V2S3_9SPHN|nr:hydrogen peroxide-inducible genes activator [Blastomonas natatoria]PXW76043.1 LysR family transcriptional regulator [Blastomonas natatoria]
MPSLRQLQYLVALDDHRHFGRAAFAVHVSQPTLSQQLRTLEARLGASLIDRSGQDVQLTPLGRDIAARARGILVQVRDLSDLARRAGKGIGGTLRFGVTPTLGPYLMPAIVAGLHREQPDLRLHIREGIPDDQVRQVMRGELDMMLCPMPVDATGIVVEPLFSERMFVIAPPDHRLAGQKDIPASELKGEGFLTLDRRHHFHRQTRDICEQLGAHIMHDYEGTSLDSIRQMVGSGIGLALLPERYMAAETQAAEVVATLDIAGWNARRSIAALWRTGAAFSDGFHAIAEFIRAYVNETA